MNRLEKEIIYQSSNRALLQTLYDEHKINSDLESATHYLTNASFFNFSYDIEGFERDENIPDDYDDDYSYGADDEQTRISLATDALIAYKYPELYDVMERMIRVSPDSFDTEDRKNFFRYADTNYAPKNIYEFVELINQIGAELCYIDDYEGEKLSLNDIKVNLPQCQTWISMIESFEKNFHFVPRVSAQISAGIKELYEMGSGNLKGQYADLDGKRLTMDDIVQRFDRKAVTAISDCGNVAFLTLAAFGYVNPNNMPQLAKEAFTHYCSTKKLKDIAQISELFRNISKDTKQSEIVSVLKHPDVAKKYLQKINGTHKVTISEVSQEIDNKWREQEKIKFEEKYGIDFSNNYINIPGAENVIEMAGLKAYILPANDLRNFTVGYDTYCCQRFGYAGESCVAAAVDRDNTGIFVIEKNGKIEAQAFVWTHGHSTADGSFVFDSIMFDNIEFANDQNLNRHDDVVRGYEEGMSVEDYEDLKKTIAFEGILAAYVENLPYKNVYMGMGYNQMGLLGRKLGEEDLINNDMQYAYEVPEIIKNMVNEAIGDTYTDFDYRARVLKKDGTMWMDYGMEMKEKDGTMVAVDELQYHLGKQDLHNPEINIFEHANVVGMTNYKGDKRFIVEVANGAKQVLAGDLSKFKSVKLDESVINDPDFNISGTAIKEVIFPEGITVLNNALGGAHFYKEPKLPDTLEVLGECALVNTSGYSDLTIPDGVKEIGPAALSDCTDLKAVWLPEGLEKLASDCFDYTELEFVSMSDNIFRDSEVPDKIFNWAYIERVAIKDTCGKAAKMAYNMIKSGDVDEVEFDGCTQMYVDKYDVGDMSFKEFEKKFVQKGHREKDYER